MPDIGGFGRGLLKGALSATEKAAEKVKEAAEAASRKMTDDDDPDATQVVKSTQDSTEPDPDTTLVIKVEDPDVTQVVRDAPTRPAAPSVPPAAAGLSASEPTVTAPPVSGVWPPASGHLTAAPPAGVPSGVGASVGGPPVAGRPVAALPTAGPHGNAPSAVEPPATPPTLAAAPVDAPQQPASTSDDGDDECADASDVRELVEMFQELLAKRRPPAGPVAGEWSVGIGDLLAEHPKVPKRVRGLILKLNRFGGLGFSPQEVSFDGDDVAWEKVTEVRTRHIVDYLVGDAVQQQVESLPMPWFPGRQRLLDALGQALLTVTIATAKDQLDGLDINFRIPAEVVYKGSFGRSKELGAGVVSALVLADPAVSQSLVATAQARGVTVTASEDEMLASADERAEQIRQKVKALEAELDRFSRRFKRTADS